MRKHSGLTPIEQRIMDLWDAGKDYRQIVAQTGLPLLRVQTIVPHFHVGNEIREHRKSMQRGTAALLAAIERAHPERICA